MIENFCRFADKIYMCVDNVTVTLYVIYFLLFVVYIIGFLIALFAGREYLGSGSIEQRKEGVVTLLVSPIWPIALLIDFLSGIVKDIIRLHKDISTEKEAERTRILEQAMVELEEMKREEHEDWMRKFNSIGSNNVREVHHDH